jgi:hypothetical protein
MSFYLMERGWQDSEFFGKNSAFSDRDAWCWMIGEAVWEDCTRNIVGHPIQLKRGQFSHSIRFMSEKFGWSSQRVQGFIKKLEAWGMISKKTDTGQTVITICNYNEYQDQRKKADTHTDTGTDTPPDTHTDTKNNHLNQLNKATHTGDQNNFRKIYDEGSAVFPTLATRRTEAITRWLEAGADPDRDILPEIRRAIGKDIRSWGYFDGAVMDAMAQRTKPMPTGQPRHAAGETKKSFSRKMMEAAAKAVENTGGME